MSAGNVVVGPWGQGKSRADAHLTAARRLREKAHCLGRSQRDVVADTMDGIALAFIGAAGRFEAIGLPKHAVWATEEADHLYEVARKARRGARVRTPGDPGEGVD
jgi:hypothetical protein